MCVSLAKASDEEYQYFKFQRLYMRIQHMRNVDKYNCMCVGFDFEVLVSTRLFALEFFNIIQRVITLFLFSTLNCVTHNFGYILHTYVCMLKENLKVCIYIFFLFLYPSRQVFYVTCACLSEIVLKHDFPLGSEN